MAHFLSYPLARPPQPVGHDILIECNSVDQFIQSYRDGMWGSVETAGAPLWKIVRRELPECKLVVVRRPLIEVYRSLTALGVVPDLSELAEINATLDLLESVPGVHTIQSSALDDPKTCEWLFEHCLEQPFDWEWWAEISPLNIQIDIVGRLEQMERRAAARQHLKAEMAERSQRIEGWH